MTGSGVISRIRQEPRRIRDISFVVAGILLFALFIHDPQPKKLIAFASLIIVAAIIARSIKEVPVWDSFGFTPLRRKVLYYLLPSMGLGAGLALLTRSTFDLSSLPGSLSGFALVAPIIGATEEIIFRGYIQGHLRPLGRLFSIIYASAVHTSYKLLVILSLDTPLQFDFFFLILWTFLGGVVFGYIRETSRSVIPSLIAHAAFDIFLYGNHTVAPVWVWS